MSRHYRELLGGHLVSEVVYHRAPYTVAVVETEFLMCGGVLQIAGCGVAKHSSCDIAAGVPWDSKRGDKIALGRAYKDAWGRYKSVTRGL